MELGNMIFGNSRGLYEVPRSWQDDFVDFLYECGFDGYGWVKNENDSYLKEHIRVYKSSTGSGDQHYFENEVFKIMPYYWGEDDEISEYPNFIYKPTNFSINWYKYPLRDSYMNQNIKLSDLEVIMDNCRLSIKIDLDEIKNKYKEIKKVIKRKETEISKLKQKLLKYENRLRIFNK